MAKKAEAPKSKAACIRDVIAAGLTTGLTQEEIAKVANEKFKRDDIKQGDVANAMQTLKGKAGKKKSAKTAKTAKGATVRVKRATGKQMETTGEMSLDELVAKFGTISAAKAALEKTLAKLQ